MGNTKLTPEEIDFLSVQYVRGRVFTSETDALALRDALAAKQPGFQFGEDALEDLSRLVPAYLGAQRSSGASQNSVAAPIPAASSPAPAPVIAPQGSSPAPAFNPGGNLLAEYEAAKKDPVALADFLSRNEKAVRRQLLVQGRGAQNDERRATPAPAAAAATNPGGNLLAEYEAAKRDPVALADFFTSNEKAVRRQLLVQGREAQNDERRPMVVIPAPAVPAATDFGGSLLSEYDAAKKDPRALATLLDPTTEKGKALRRLIA